MNVYDIIIQDKEKVLPDDIFLQPESKQAINQLINEFNYVDELSKYNLPVNNKILLYGSSGSGKTTTAKAIANALKKPIYILNLSNFVCSRIGETSQNLKMVFDKASRDNAVLFLDEFDQIGKMRSNDDRDVGEMRRLVNTLIQLIDYFPNKSLLLGATNYIEMLDKALIRRFQLILHYQQPTKTMLDAFYEKLLSTFPKHLQHIQRKYDISFAEAKDYAFTTLKSIVITELELKKSRLKDE